MASIYLFYAYWRPQNFYSSPVLYDFKFENFQLISSSNIFKTSSIFLVNLSSFFLHIRGGGGKYFVFLYQKNIPNFCILLLCLILKWILHFFLAMLLLKCLMKCKYTINPLLSNLRPKCIHHWYHIFEKSDWEKKGKKEQKERNWDQ